MVNGLTRKQEAFVIEYVRHGNATLAAKLAGYSPKWASEAGYKLVQKSTVKEAIRAYQEEIEQQLRLQFIQDALKARKVMREILDNPASSDRDRLTAARDLLDRAGFKAVEKRELSGSDNKAIEIVFVNQ